MFQTKVLKGSSPKWDESCTVITRDGTVSMKLFEKGNILSSDKYIGRVIITIYKIKKVKFRQIYDIINDNKKTIGTLDVTLHIK